MYTHINTHTDTDTATEMADSLSLTSNDGEVAVGESAPTIIDGGARRPAGWELHSHPPPDTMQGWANQTHPIRAGIFLLPAYFRQAVQVPPVPEQFTLSR